MSQRLKIYNHLIKKGKITATQAEKMGINRLAVMIERLRKQGHNITTYLAYNNQPTTYVYKK